MLTALRSGPGIRAPQARGVRVEGKEVASVLNTEAMEDTTWVKISCSTGQGWIKREHLRYEPVAKRRRRGDEADRWRCSVDDLGSGSVVAPLIREFEEVLAVHCVKLGNHVVGDRKSPSDGAATGDGAGVAKDKLTFYLPEVTLEGPGTILDAMRHDKIGIKVAGNLVQFRSPKNVKASQEEEITKEEGDAKENGNGIAKDGGQASPKDGDTKEAVSVKEAGNTLPAEGTASAEEGDVTQDQDSAPKEGGASNENAA